MKSVACLLLGTAASSSLTNGWKRTEGTPSTSVSVRFALQKSAPSALEQALLAIADPKSSRFRNYLSDAEIAELVRPRPGAVEAVEMWIRSSLGSKAQIEHSKHGEYLTVSMTAVDLKESFRDVIEDVAIFNHEESSKKTVKAVAFGATPTSLVPADLKEHVWAVLDLVELLPVPPRKFTSTGEPGDTIEPPAVHKQYGLLNDPDAIGGKTAASQGVAMFEQSEFRQSDVDDFQNKYSLPSVDFQVNGPNNGGYYGEAGLDTQWITATGRGVPSWFIARDAFDMLAWCEQVLNMTKPPSVVSISWGSGESNYAVEHMQAGSDCFQKMGAQGISVFTASGDDGTGKKGLFRCTGFEVDWPASCPYVTTVGGTYLESGSENAWTGSGGGFSTVFSRPSWQDTAVAGYQQSATLPASNLFPADGCAKPDIAALATNYAVCSGGCAGGTLTGTSAASPAFAGMVSLINDKLVGQGKPTVGFINPTLYAAAEASGKDSIGFDVVTGNNKHAGCKAGFPAVEGWDAVTGLGTPVFKNLKIALMGNSSVIV